MKEFTPQQAEDLYELIDECNRSGSLVVASNRSPPTGGPSSPAAWSPQQLEELEGVEILFAPIGGTAATLELVPIVDLWERLKPRIVFPMDLRTPKCAFLKYGAEDLVRLRPAAHKVGTSQLSVAKNSLPAPTQIQILDPSR